MATINPTREIAFNLLKEYNKTESLIKHALSVESVMRYFAEKYDEDIEKWGIIGLVHDLDYEMFPKLHCQKALEILNNHSWPEEYIHAVISHGWGICSDIEPVLFMEKVLFATDELTGLITAAALVRPSKSILDLNASSVLKRWKEKRFAAGVDRSIIEKGAEMIAIDLSNLVTETILAMRKVANEIGLKGNL